MAGKHAAMIEVHGSIVDQIRQKSVVTENALSLGAKPGSLVR